MAFDVRISGENARVILSGDVDLQTTSDLKTEITKITGVTHLEIDASAVTYIDSSGVAVLLMARQFCAQQNIAISLPAVSAAVHRVLEIAKLDKILPIGQIVSSSNPGEMGVAAADASNQSVSDDDLAAELLGGIEPAPVPSPAPSPASTSAPADPAPSAGASEEPTGDGPASDDIAPGSFG